MGLTIQTSGRWCERCYQYIPPGVLYHNCAPRADWRSVAPNGVESLSDKWRLDPTRLRALLIAIESCNYTTHEGEPLAMHADWQELKRLAGMESGK